MHKIPFTSPEEAIQFIGDRENPMAKEEIECIKQIQKIFDETVKSQSGIDNTYNFGVIKKFIEKIKAQYSDENILQFIDKCELILTQRNEYFKTVDPKNIIIEVSKAYLENGEFGGRSALQAFLENRSEKEFIELLNSIGDLDPLNRDFTIAMLADAFSIWGSINANKTIEKFTYLLHSLEAVDFVVNYRDELRFIIEKFKHNK